MDVATTNNHYTWSNKRSGDRHIASRLDRFLSSECLLTKGGDSAALVLPTAGSDHWPISLKWRWPGENLRRPFIFKQFWLTKEDFKPKVKQWWNEFVAPAGSVMYQFQHKLKYIKEKIKKWNQEVFENILHAKKQIEK